MANKNKNESHDDFGRTLKDRHLQVEWIRRLERLAQQELCGVVRFDSDSNDTDADNHPLSLRSLYSSEVTTLESSCRCRCRDWSKVRLLLPTAEQRLDQSVRLADFVSDTTFDGTVVLIWRPPLAAASSSEGDRDDDNDKVKEWSRLPLGIHGNLVVSDSMVHLDSWVYRNAVVSDSYVAPQAVVVNCGTISSLHDPTTEVSTVPFDYSVSIVVGPETGGGRKLNLTPECTMLDVGRQLRGQPTTEDEDDDDGADGTRPSAKSLRTWNVISSRSVLRDTATCHSVYLYPTSSVVAASYVSRAVLFPGATVTNGSTVEDVLMQWNTAVADGSAVRSAVLMEGSNAGPHSYASNAVLGPDAHVSLGEVHASLLGPNCNAHHQSLVIGVVWPSGRGNVAAGSNLGSNHTGRIPDQECVPAEGCFWGLGCTIKFPVNLQGSPYTVVAAGTTLPPQRISMPFSLILPGAGGNNEILPGWLLGSSPYTLARSERKFATRRSAARHSNYTGWRIFRPSIVAQCFRARRALLMQSSPKGKNGEIGGKAHPVQGIGPNRLTERGRQAGIRAYTACIRRFALHGLLSRLVAISESGRVNLNEDILAGELLPLSGDCDAVAAGSTLKDGGTEDGDDAIVVWKFPWEEGTGNNESDWWTGHQRRLLLQEFPPPPPGSVALSAWVRETLLPELLDLERDYCRRVYKSKKRDDLRGIETLPGYESAHVLADDDPVVIETRAELRRTEEAALAFLRGDLGGPRLPTMEMSKL